MGCGGRLHAEINRKMLPISLPPFCAETGSISRASRPVLLCSSGPVAFAPQGRGRISRTLPKTPASPGLLALGPFEWFPASRSNPALSPPRRRIARPVLIARDRDDPARPAGAAVWLAEGCVTGSRAGPLSRVTVVCPATESSENPGDCAFAVDGRQVIRERDSWSRSCCRSSFPRRPP